MGDRGGWAPWGGLLGRCCPFQATKSLPSWRRARHSGAESERGAGHNTCPSGCAVRHRAAGQPSAKLGNRGQRSTRGNTTSEDICGALQGGKIKKVTPIRRHQTGGSEMGFGVDLLKPFVGPKRGSKSKRDADPASMSKNAKNGDRRRRRWRPKKMSFIFCRFAPP